MRASFYGNYDSLMLLINHGANMNNWENTALTIALIYGHTNCAQLLTESRADPNGKSEQKINERRLLLDKRRHINVDERGWTP
jgi:ankyrin repeat protein